jgi:hypothetical protein
MRRGNEQSENGRAEWEAHTTKPDNRNKDTQRHTSMSNRSTPSSRHVPLRTPSNAFTARQSRAHALSLARAAMHHQCMLLTLEFGFLLSCCMGAFFCSDSEGAGCGAA